MASYHPVPSLYSLTDVGSMDSIHLHDQTSHPVAAAVRTAKRPPWSLRRTYRDSSSDERVYLCVVLFEAVTVTALAMAAFLVMVTRMPPSNKQTLGVSVYMAIFVLGRLFSLLYSLDAIRARNVIQLVLHICFQLCMFVYAVTEIPQTRSALRNLDDARACVPRGGTYDCLGKGSLYFILLNILVWPIVITAIATAGYVFLARRLHVSDVRVHGVTPQAARVLRERLLHGGACTPTPLIAVHRSHHRAVARQNRADHHRHCPPGLLSYNRRNRLGANHRRRGSHARLLVPPLRRRSILCLQTRQLVAAPHGQAVHEHARDSRRVFGLCYSRSCARNLWQLTPARGARERRGVPAQLWQGFAASAPRAAATSGGGVPALCGAREGAGAPCRGAPGYRVGREAEISAGGTTQAHDTRRTTYDTRHTALNTAHTHDAAADVVYLYMQE